MTAHALAYDRAPRPKLAKLYTNVVLHGRVEQESPGHAASTIDSHAAHVSLAEKLLMIHSQTT